MKAKTKKFVAFELIPVLVAFSLIAGLGAYYGQMLIKILPVCISLVVVLLSARANRYTFLLGAANSVLYMAGYFLEKLYGTVLSAAFGAVLQLVSFFRWRSRAYGRATRFRKMRGGVRAAFVAAFAAAWGVAAFALGRAGGNAVALDSLSLVLGFTLPVLIMFAYLEALPLQILNSALVVALWISIIAQGNLANLTYLVSGVYGFYMTVRMVITWITLYRAQRAEERCAAAVRPTAEGGE